MVIKQIQRGTRQDVSMAHTHIAERRGSRTNMDPACNKRSSYAIREEHVLYVKSTPPLVHLVNTLAWLIAPHTSFPSTSTWS